MDILLNRIKQSIWFGFILLLTFASCKRRVFISEPAVKTGDVTYVGAISVIVEGEFIDFGEQVNSFGFCWSPRFGPTLKNSTIDLGANPESRTFESLLTDLKPNTVYYIRAFVISGDYVAYGNEAIIRTKQGYAGVETMLAEASYFSAIVSGRTTSNDGDSIISRGICWMKNTPEFFNLRPNINADKIEIGNGIGYFSDTLKNLEPSTKYKIRAYATNKVRTTYGDLVYFSTDGGNKFINSPQINDIGVTSVGLTSTFSTTSPFEIIERGLIWNTTGNPTLSDSILLLPADNDSHLARLETLNANSTYYIRAFVTTDRGNLFSNQSIFTTQNGGTEFMNSPQINDIRATSVGLTSTFSTTSPFEIIERGLIWNTTGNPTLSDSILLLPADNDSHLARLENLNANSTYYIRAFVTTDRGNFFSNQSIFTTQSGIPEIKTYGSSNIRATSITISGEILSDGGDSIISRGVCWSTSEMPTLNDQFVIIPGDIGFFETRIANLTANTAYYFRVFATSRIVTSYGESLNKKTLDGIPKINTKEVVAIKTDYARSGGEILQDGGDSIQSSGICWSTFETPTINDFVSINTSGSISFSSTINYLNPNTTYYIRAFATNSIATGYGEVLQFTTFQSLLDVIYDIDSNSYQTVQIGTQKWMAENLRTSLFNNGNPILTILGSSSWPDAAFRNYPYTGYYEGKIVNKQEYGSLYNYYVVENGDVCPVGWHVPSKDEWKTLAGFLGGDTVAGGKMKSTNNGAWMSPNMGATNESGFTALGGGYITTGGNYWGKAKAEVWWTSTTDSLDTNKAWFRSLKYDSETLNKNSAKKVGGFSIRCVKN